MQTSNNNKQTSMTQITFKLTQEDYDTIKNEAEILDISISEYIRDKTLFSNNDIFLLKNDKAQLQKENRLLKMENRNYRDTEKDPNGLTIPLTPRLKRFLEKVLSDNNKYKLGARVSIFLFAVMRVNTVFKSITYQNNITEEELERVNNEISDFLNENFLSYAEHQIEVDEDGENDFN